MLNKGGGEATGLLNKEIKWGGGGGGGGGQQASGLVTNQAVEFPQVLASNKITTALRCLVLLKLGMPVPPSFITSENNFTLGCINYYTR